VSAYTRTTVLIAFGAALLVLAIWLVKGG